MEKGNGQGKYYGIEWRWRWDSGDGREWKRREEEKEGMTRPTWRILHTRARTHCIHIYARNFFFCRGSWATRSAGGA